MVSVYLLQKFRSKLLNPYESAGFGAHKNERKQMLETKKVGSVMIVGGGVTGMQAALDLADSGYYVYLVERSGAIGGAMAQLDKTFPTNDCSM